MLVQVIEWPGIDWLVVFWHCHAYVQSNAEQMSSKKNRMILFVAGCKKDFQLVCGYQASPITFMWFDGRLHVIALRRLLKIGR